MSELDQRKNTQLGPSGNPHRFVELIGGKEVNMSFYEPDPKTYRSDYYYNTRQNKLFKRIVVINPLKNNKTYYWKTISDC